MTTFVPALGRFVSVLLAVLTLAAAAVLLAWDASPGRFPRAAHDVLGALPLALIAVAYLAHQIVRRPRAFELLKAVLLAAAFLFWAANQRWPALPQATLFNDLAIVLFALDLVLVIVGRQP